ncbi:MAG: hypothetical protein WAM26_15450 [Nitrososphaeraceae archaeon]
MKKVEAELIHRANILYIKGNSSRSKNGLSIVHQKKLQNISMDCTGENGRGGSPFCDLPPYPGSCYIFIDKLRINYAEVLTFCLV